jgi:hypothetical protein
MRNEKRNELLVVTALLVALALLPARPIVAADTSATTAVGADAQGAPAPEEKPKPQFNIYGYVQLDTGYDTKQVDPNWFDVLRPTKLPSYKDQFGADGNTYMSVRQTRFGVKASAPTSLGDLKTTFEWELFGVGVDAGQTTIRLRHAYLELGHFGAGQTWSPFMDPDVFPNSLEYWGPNGMVFFRNVQVRWMPIMGDTKLIFALERPGASGDAGNYADRIELATVKAHFPYPDLSVQYRHQGDWGHVQLSGIVRRLEWVDTNPAPTYNLSGSANGWGVNISSNIKFRKADVLRLSYIYGEGVENYMNDAPADLGIQTNPGNAVQPVVGKLLPVTGIVVFYDLAWNDKWTTSIGASSVTINNSNGQAPDAFKRGEYALVNLLCTPVKDFMVGGEVQWGKRENFSDGWSVNDLRVQLSARANFSVLFGGNK